MLTTGELATAPKESEAKGQRNTFAKSTQEGTSEPDGAFLSRVLRGAPGEPPMDGAVRILRSPALSHPASSGLRAISLTRTQQTFGNRFAQRAVAPVSRKPAPARSLQRQCSCGGTCAACRGKAVEEEEQKLLQRKAAQAGAAGGLADSSVVPANSTGHALDEDTQTFIEGRFGSDFSGVRVHTDGAATKSADALQAHAYTIGRDIYFAAGKYEPASQEGQHLIAHELAHVAQQENGAIPASPAREGDVLIGDASDPLEAEAEQAADAISAGGRISARPISGGTQRKLQRYSWDEFTGDVEGAVSSVGEAAVAVGETVEGAARTIGEGAAAAGEAIQGGLTAAGEAMDWLATAAGLAAREGANSLAALFGGSVVIRGGCLVITIPEIPLFPSFERTLAETPPAGFFVPLAPPVAALIGPLPIAGIFGVLGYAQASLQAAVGPGVVRGIRLELCPFSNRYLATGQLYVAAAIAPRLTLFGGLAAAIGTVIPFEPPIPVVAIVQGGLRGTGTGWLIGAVQDTVTLTYSAGTLAMNNVTDLMAGILLQGDVDLFAALRLGEKIICQYAYPLTHWEAGEAWRLTIPIQASLSRGGGGAGSVGPITHGPMPVQDIVTAIHPLETGWNCLSQDEIERFLCENGILPPELCEQEEGEAALNIAGSCVANDNLGEAADPFISRCRKASIRSEFPGELLSETLGNIKKGKTARHKKAWKLLNDNRFKKPGASTTALPALQTVADTCANSLSEEFEMMVDRRTRTIKVRDSKHTRMAKKTLGDMVAAARANNCDVDLAEQCEKMFCHAAKQQDRVYGSQIDANTRRLARYKDLLRQAWDGKTPPSSGNFDEPRQDDSDVGFDIKSGGPTRKYRVKATVTTGGKVFTETHLFPE